MTWLYRKSGAHQCSDTRPDSDKRTELAGVGSLWQCDCLQVWEVTGYALISKSGRFRYLWRRYTDG